MLRLLLGLLGAVVALQVMRKQEEAPTAENSTIEVGAADGTLRHWLAKEAVRQGEIAIGAQMAVIQSLATRATTLMGWSVTVASALAAAAISGPWTVPASAAAAFMILSGLCAFIGLWPRDWKLAGHDSEWLLSGVLPSELETLESMALGSAAGIKQNARALRRFAFWLRAAWVFFLLAPVAGFAAWKLLMPAAKTLALGCYL